MALSVRSIRITVLVAFCFAAAGVLAAETPVSSDRAIFHPVFAAQGMVSTQEATATRVGVNVLRAGGNAVDAAVAVGFALAVTLPQAGNLGGGGFMLIHFREKGETVAVDYRETAPAAAERNMYLDAQGRVVVDRARNSLLSVGVPGTVAGLVLALETYGTLSLPEALAPAIKLARDGIAVDQALAFSLQRARERLVRWPETKKVFFKPDGVGYVPGERLFQPDLASSLEKIAHQGTDAFYRGAIAANIVKAMKTHGGLITEDDLESYRALIREPVRGTYRDFTVLSMPPPSSGGVHLVQMLNILEGFPIEFLGSNSAATIHFMVEAMKLAYADRSTHLGDPAFSEVPVAKLVSKAYAAELRKKIPRYRARPSVEIRPGKPGAVESTQTTHYSVMDADGNVVSNTYTLNFPYGSGFVVPQTGILLNNEMDDFSAKPGVPNAYGLVGGEANAIEPHKRPLSSMTPTIVFKDGHPLLAAGSPGGSHIITTVLQVILNVIDHQMNIASATATPRVHHQWLPDELRVEQGLSPDTLYLLAQMGYTVAVRDAMGSAQSVMRIEQGFLGVSDPRTPEGLSLGY